MNNAYLSAIHEMIYASKSSGLVTEEDGNMILLAVFKLLACTSDVHLLPNAIKTLQGNKEFHDFLRKAQSLLFTIIGRTKRQTPEDRERLNIAVGSLSLLEDIVANHSTGFDDKRARKWWMGEMGTQSQIHGSQTGGDDDDERRPLQEYRRNHAHRLLEENQEQNMHEARMVIARNAPNFRGEQNRFEFVTTAFCLAVVGLFAQCARELNDVFQPLIRALTGMMRTAATSNEAIGELFKSMLLGDTCHWSVRPVCAAIDGVLNKLTAGSIKAVLDCIILFLETIAASAQTVAGLSCTALLLIGLVLAYVMYFVAMTLSRRQVQIGWLGVYVGPDARHQIANPNLDWAQPRRPRIDNDNNVVEEEREREAPRRIQNAGRIRAKRR